MSDFTYPFRYSPSAEVRAAADAVISAIEAEEGLRQAFSEGKMLGVLVVEPPGSVAPGIASMPGSGAAVRTLPDGTAYLAAFSGNAGGQSIIPGFVPPVFDLLDKDGYFKKEEARIVQMSRRISSAGEEEAACLKKERSAMSDALQKWIFGNYIVRNGLGERKNILEIFSEKGLVPPGGTGDCAAPKLLHFAFTHNLKPVSMGEFWYGGSHTGEFYPSCSSKCGPLLRWMLRGVQVENPYGFDEGTVPKIIWEDDSLMVVDKPAGMLCVPGKDGQKSLIERLPQPAFSVHRLDMDTSGVLVVAKTLRSQATLQRQFEDRKVRKRYIALVENRAGLSAGDSGTVSLPVRPDIDNRPVQIVDYTFGREAVTDYTVLEAGAQARVLFEPHTGRTHQLRVHSAKGLGCPIVGDLLYGADYSPRLCLHAETISLTHPLTGEPLNFTVRPQF